MVTHVDEISTPPTPADAPEVFEQRASQVWSDLARAVPQFNQAASEIEQIGQDAGAAKVRAIAEADAAMGYRNEAVAARDSAQADAVSAAQADASAVLAAARAETAAASAENRVPMTGPAGAAILPEGTDAERPAPGATGLYVRLSKTASKPEWYNRAKQEWQPLTIDASVLKVLVSPQGGQLCLAKTAAGTISVKAGTRVLVGAEYKVFLVDTAVTMPALTAGADYSVWVKPDVSVVAVADPYSSPATAPDTGAVKIGGFHYGLVAPGITVAGGSFATTGVGMIWTQADVDKIAGINTFSIWDLNYRPKCDPRGMARSDAGFWFDIYFCGSEHITNGTSRYNSDVASGTVLPKIPIIFGGDGTKKYTTLTWYEANEIALSHGKRLMSYQEFAAAAYGVTENQSLGGPGSTIPATLRQPGYTSKTGGEQMTGHHSIWGAMAHGVGGSAWASGAGRGQTYGTPYGSHLGGDRGFLSYSGSRCSNWGNSAWVSAWYVGLRAACDHYQGAY